MHTETRLALEAILTTGGLRAASEHIPRGQAIPCIPGPCYAPHPPGTWRWHPSEMSARVPTAQEGQLWLPLAHRNSSAGEAVGSYGYKKLVAKKTNVTPRSQASFPLLGTQKPCLLIHFRKHFQLPCFVFRTPTQCSTSSPGKEMKVIDVLSSYSGSLYKSSLPRSVVSALFWQAPSRKSP